MKALNYLSPFLLIFVIILDSVLCTPIWYAASDGRKYLIEADRQYNWFQANHHCARNNAKLVIIDSEPKNNALIGVFNTFGINSSFWLGGNDEYSSSRDKNRPFYWSHTGQKFSYTYWAPGQPDNGNNIEHCVYIWNVESSRFKWNDNDCTNEYGYICEP